MTMRQLDRGLRRIGVRALGAAVLLGCGDRSADSAALDTALARDLTLASSATPTVAIGDTAVSQAPSAPEPAPAPRPSAPPAPVSRASSRPTPAPAPTVAQVAPVEAPTAAPATPAPEPAAAAPARTRAIGTGVTLSGPTSTAICSLANRPGDRFVISLSDEVRSPDGATLPAGTPVLVEMAPPAADGGFAFRLRGVQLDGAFVPAEGTVRVIDATTTERQVSKGGDQGKVITGAVIGGILGRVLGGGARGAVIGAAGGAAAGTVAATRNTVTERCLPSGALLIATLTAPLVLPTGTP
jgi:hypothetical protein